MAVDLVSVGLVVCVIGLLWLLTRRPSKFPPGPFRLPFIGNVLTMDSDPKVAFTKLRRQYGDIFSVYVFNEPIIVMSGYDNLKEAFVKRADVFSNRPHSLIRGFQTKPGGVVTTSGSVWKEQRRFALTTLRNLGMGKSVIEDKIQEELVVFLQAIEDEKQQPLDPAHLFENAVSNVICSVVFGKRFDYTDPIFQKFLKCLSENISVGITSVGRTFPFLKYLPGDLFNFKRTIRNRDMIDNEFIKPQIKKHIALKDDNNDDFIAAYIEEMGKNNKGESIDMMNLEKTVTDLFAAGTETTSTTLRWALTYFLNYPEVQEKCFQEIKENIGLNRSPTMKDKTSLPYLEATISETMRKGDIVPTSVPHAVSEDVEYLGYIIPKGKMIIPFIESVLQDPAIWGDPDNFRPERFLDEAGKFKKMEKFIPFSLGRRVCLGESLARMELFLFLTSMIQRFEFVTVDGVKPSLNGNMGITNSPKPFKVKARKRQ